nr:hypothetical protein [Rhodococcus sp. (in: high G+C Gram-positive bacteria)]
MGYLAITIGDDKSVAVHRPDRGVDPIVYETTTRLWFAEDGTIGLGPDGVDAGPSPRSATASISRVGNGQGDEFPAEDLLAHAVNCLVSMVTDRHGGVVPSVAMTYPDAWRPDTLALLRGALDRTGGAGVLLVPSGAASGAFAALVPTTAVDVDAAPIDDDVSLSIGTLSVLEGAEPPAPDSAATDALPIVARPRALAFSEALPVVEPTSAITPITEDSGSRRRPLLIVTGAAVAVIIASVGIAAALGTFSDGADVNPPAITDAQTAPAPSSTTTPVPSAAIVVVPFPTATPDAASEQPAAPDPTDVTEPTLAQPPPPEPSPEPEAPAPDVPTTRGPLTRPTIPEFTYPTIPRFDSPGR